MERAAWYAKVVAGPTGVGSHYRAALDGAKPIHPAHFTADQVHQLKVRGGNSGTVTRLYSKPGVQPRKEARSRNHETPGTTATDAAVRPGPERLRAAGDIRRSLGPSLTRTLPTGTVDGLAQLLVDARADAEAGATYQFVTVQNGKMVSVDDGGVGGGPADTSAQSTTPPPRPHKPTPNATRFQSGKLPPTTALVCCATHGYTACCRTRAWLSSTRGNPT